MKVAEINLRSKSKVVCVAVCVSRLGSVKTLMKATKVLPTVLACDNHDLFGSSLKRPGASGRLRKFRRAWCELHLCHRREQLWRSRGALRRCKRNARVRSESRRFQSIDFPGAVLTVAQGINDLGQIVGSFQDGDAVDHGFVLSRGVFHQVDFPGSIDTQCHGINKQGQIVGRYHDFRTPAAGGNKDHEHGFLLSDEHFTSIDFPDSVTTDAWKITDSDDIVGDWSSNGNFYVHGYILHAGHFTSFDFPGFPPDGFAEDQYQRPNDRNLPKQAAQWRHLKSRTRTRISAGQRRLQQLRFSWFDVNGWKRDQ